MSPEKDILQCFQKVREVSFGARFYKVDFHFHTPASEDARGKNRYNFNPYKIKYPIQKGNTQQYYDKIRAKQDEILADSRKIAEQIVKRFIEEKLSLVAVTDHNSIGTICSDPEAGSAVMDLKAPTWYEIIDDEAEKINNQAGKRVMTILPGVEISCTGIHILAIFPPYHPRRGIHFVICDLLSEIGFGIDEWGKNPKVGKRSVIDAVNLIHQKGGIPIPAHIDGSDQALLKLHKLSGGAMKNVFYNEKLSAVEIVKPKRFTRKDKKLKKPLKNWIDSLRTKKELTSLAYFQGSDAHDLKSIGKRFTFLKMTEPSYEGLKNAITIPSSRIRISDAHSHVVKGVYIYGVEVENKYFGKVFLRFNRHLNCITGKKEVGKSYLFKLMQKAVNQELTNVEGSVKLFVEEVSDSKSSYYGFSCSDKGGSVDLYSIDKDKKSVVKKDLEKTKDLAIEPKFYRADVINALISSKKSLNEFMIRHFGQPTKKNIGDFNKLFSISNFLQSKNDQLLFVEMQENTYKLCLNINWRQGKEKMRDFFRLNNSLKRIVMIIMIIIGDGFGPVVIDAPEDYYDNEDIVHFFIPLIKKYKDFRQIIFFTNNPILAVNSDPENYVLLHAEGKKLKNVITGFSIDKIDKKEEIIKLMEGSIKSFSKRRGRYGL